MQHFAPIYVAIIFVGAILIQSEAKRGCALYGHSCYGGHGKRSEMPRGELLPMESGPVPIEKLFQSNKDFVYPNNNELNGINQMDANNDLRWKSRNELEYAVYNLLRQWIDEAKKSAAEAQRPSESETVYKNNLV